jgi:hypothetical protein
MSGTEQGIIHQPVSQPELTRSEMLLDILERCFHSSNAEWLFLRELRVGTGHRNSFAQRLDAFALNCLPHLAMKRVCYEVKVSRADFLSELKHPLKRRIGLRYSNEFYFLTPAGLLNAAEIPIECGLIEIGSEISPGWRQQVDAAGGIFHFDRLSGAYCAVTVPAQWRDTPGPTWQFAASMLRNQRRSLELRPPPAPKQQKLTLTGEQSPS